MTDQPDDYAAQHLRDALAADDRVGEMGLQVRTVAGKVFLTGEVATPERQQAVGAVAAEVLPGYEVHNETVVTLVGDQHRVERLQ